MAAIEISLPIVKYSHALGQTPDKHILWNHLSDPEMFLILRGSYHRMGPLMLRVVRGTMTLEQVDNLGDLIEEAVHIRDRALSAGLTPHFDDLSVFAICKDNVIAFRYRLNGDARRLQFRLQNAEDCQKVVTALKVRDLQFQEQRPHTGRPGTAATERLNTARSEARALMATQTASPHFSQAPQAVKPSPFHVPAMEAGSLSKLPPTRTEPYLTNKSHLTSTGFQMPPPRTFTRDESVAPREVVPSPPTTSSLYKSFTTSFQPNASDVSSLRRHVEQSNKERPTSTIRTTDVGANRRAANARELSLAPSIAVSPSARQSIPQQCSSGVNRSYESTGLSSDPNETRPGTALSVASTSSLRPGTAPTILDFPTFHRGGSNSSSRPSSAALALPPLPKPKVGTTPSYAKRFKPDSTERPASAHPVSHHIDSSSTAQSVKMYSPDRGTVDRPVTATGINLKRTVSPALERERAIPVDELLSKRKPLAERSINSIKVSRLDSTYDAPHELETPPGSASYSTAGNAVFAQPRTSTVDDGTMERAYAALKATTSASDDQALENYTAQPPQDREAMLDQFMIDNLENPSFTTLCEDVENCWRRIALGL